MEVFSDPYASDPWCWCPKTHTRLNALDRAIFSTIAYRDVFDFAPNAEEIHRYLHGMRCGLADVRASLKKGALPDHYLATDGTYFALQNRAHLIAARRIQQANTARFWPLALRYARFLSSLPHVRMVGLTGSFAAQNMREDGDIDFFLLTEPGTMWRTRALAKSAAALNHIAGKGILCPNYFLSLAALRLDRQSLYDAQELAQMIPLFGHSDYVALRAANDWTREYLPNSDGAPLPYAGFNRPPMAAIKRVIEWLSHSFAGRALENFESRRKIHRFNETDRLKGAWTKSTRETHSLRDYIRQDIEAAWRRRVEAMEAAES